MAVYVDTLTDHRGTLGGRAGQISQQWCHLTADSLDELHEMAARIGLRRAHFQEARLLRRCHYDLTPRQRAATVACGATEITRADIRARVMREGSAPPLALPEGSAPAYAGGVTLLFPGGPPVETRLVTALAPHEVFVVPTNARGIHGRGAAGMAFRGNGDRHYRRDPVFLRAQAAPPGHPDRVGRWAIFGQATGGMQGHEGRSYGVVTVTEPGAPLSVSPAELARACAQLCATARCRPDLTFLIPPLGCGLARGQWETFSTIWQAVARRSGPLPPGLVFVRPDEESRAGGPPGAVRL